MAEGISDMPSTVVIFYSPGDAWRMGTVLPYEPNATTGQVQDAENRQLYTVRLPEDIYYMRSPLPFPDEIEDLLLLSDVHWGPLLCSLRIRFQDERFCTSVGRDSMLCINPAKPIANDMTPHLYLQDQQNLPPHPWMQASRALMHVNNTGNDAVISLAGDPGSGKTTAAKQMIDLLLTQLPHTAQSQSSVVTLRVAAQVSEELFVTTVTSAFGLPPSSLKVLSVQPESEHAEYTFRFHDAGQEGERRARDFQSFANLVPPEIRSSLGAVSSSVKEARVWPSRSVAVITEALCHARTTRNANASKAIVLHRFAMANKCLVGTEVRTYLLESNRATGPPHGERTFHIFYYLLAGASDWERARYHLPLKEELGEMAFAVLGRSRAAADSSGRSPWEQSMASLHSMGASGDWTADIEELTSSYEELIDAFDACKVSHRLQDWIFKMLSAILHLGQLNFVSSQSGATVVAPTSQDSLANVADCLQVNKDSLESALTKHIHKVRSEPVDIRLTPMQACSARDCLMRSLYEKVVDITVATLNNQLMPQEEVSGWVSILDYMGTEDGVHNDINALATNYANEVLQNFYNKVVYNDDVKECREELGEDYNVSNAAYTDVYCIVKLMRANMGLFSIIDEESSQQAPSDTTLLDTLQSRLGNHPNFERKTIVGNTFTVSHSSGPIDYNTTGFCASNRNVVLPNDLRQCLAVSLCKYTSQVFLTPQELKQKQAIESEHGKSTQGDMPADFVAVNARLQLAKSASNKTTFLAKVKHQLFSLLSLVEEAKPFFIRCIRPAKGLSGTGPLFHGRHVMKQLHSFDVLSTLQQKQMSYAVRQPFSSLLQTLWLLSYDLPQSPDPRQQVCQLCESYGLGEDAFRAGKTMAFLSKSAYTLLLDKQKAKEKALAEVVQAFCRGALDTNNLQHSRDALIKEMKEQLSLKNTVQQKLKWEGEKAQRELMDKQSLVQEEARSRRNVDNQEAVDYIAIMTGLIEGVEHVREARSQKRKQEEREKQLRLRSLLSEERNLEERRSNDRLTQRMLAQGGRLDRILTKKYQVEEGLREKRDKMASTQQRLMEFRVNQEKKRIKTERELLKKEAKHDSFIERKRFQRCQLEEKKLAMESSDKKAREARLRARKAWEEAKREEFDLDMIEREVIHKVEAELLESKNRENHVKKAQKEEALRLEKEKLERLEKIRIAKQLQREKQEKLDKERSAEAQKKKERDAWNAQQQQRHLKSEMSKIQEAEEKRRFARRQRDKLRVGAPEVFSQLVEPLMRGSSVGVSPSRRSVSQHRLPSYMAPPSPFVMTNGKAIHSPMLGPSKKAGLFDYQESIHRKSRSSYSVSPTRFRP